MHTSLSYPPPRGSPIPPLPHRVQVPPGRVGGPGWRRCRRRRGSGPTGSRRSAASKPRTPSTRSATPSPPSSCPGGGQGARGGGGAQTPSDSDGPILTTFTRTNTVSDRGCPNRFPGCFHAGLASLGHKRLLPPPPGAGVELGGGDQDLQDGLRVQQRLHCRGVPPTPLPPPTIPSPAPHSRARARPSAPGVPPVLWKLMAGLSVEG